MSPVCRDETLAGQNLAVNLETLEFGGKLADA